MRVEAFYKVYSEHIGGNSGSEHAEAVPMRTGGCGHTDANLPQDVLRCSLGGSVHTETRRTEQSVLLGGSVHAEAKGHKCLRLSRQIVHSSLKDMWVEVLSGARSGKIADRFAGTRLAMHRSKGLAAHRDPALL